MAVLIMVVGLTFATANAQELPVEVIEVAAEARPPLDPVDLAGAVNSTGLSPRTYAVMVGHLAPPPAPIPPVWDRLAVCESTSTWNANTGNGYFGGLQADMAFWRRHGGLAYAPRPDLASRAQQIDVAQRGQAVQGWGAWPVCSRRLGLR